MSIHNICFHGETRKISILFFFFLNNKEQKRTTKNKKPYLELQVGVEKQACLRYHCFHMAQGLFLYIANQIVLSRYPGGSVGRVSSF